MSRASTRHLEAQQPRRSQRASQHLAPVRARAWAATGRRQADKSFEELKRLIHGKLVDKLDCHARRRPRRRRPAPRNPPGRRAPVRHREPAAQPHRARAAHRRGARRDVRPRPARAAAQGPDDQRYPDQRPEQDLRRAPRQAGKDRRQVPRQRAPAADHRPHRVEGRPARRRNVARWSTPACPTARRVNAIIPPLALDGAVGLAFAASAPTRSSSKTCSTTRRSRPRWRCCWRRASRPG